MAGQILTEEPKAPKSIIKEGDKRLARDREKLFKALVVSAVAIKTLTKQLSTEITSKIDPDLLVETGTSLTPSASSSIYSRAIVDLKKVVEEADSVIRRGVANSLLRSSRVQNNFLARAGITPLSQDQLDKIQEDVFKLMDKEFPPGSGITYRMRLNGLMKNHSEQLKRILNRRYLKDKAVSSLVRDIRNGITHTEATQTPVLGGSVAKKLQRIMVAEETRLANEIERRIVSASGIKFGYWRLSPLHKWYGGNEICEILADAEYTDIIELLEKNGVSSAGIATSGLYPLKDWPSYPHPYCQCYLEPLV